MKKILYFISTSVKCIFWLIYNEIRENEDLQRNRDEFEICLKTKPYFLI